MDYWSLKRDIKVLVLASLRQMDSALLEKEELTFSNGKVVNYNPTANQNFEDSIEIEVFATQNMVIPYSAIMAIYETK